jgi:5-methylcytosine-specific restriction endonuclease McrA
MQALALVEPATDFDQSNFRVNFYKTDHWLRLRYEAILRHGASCQCCGQRRSPRNPLQVDHIKPRSLFPWLALDPDNLQVLCRDCNLGKSNVDCTDWRDYNDTT